MRFSKSGGVENPFRLNRGQRTTADRLTSLNAPFEKYPKDGQGVMIRTGPYPVKLFLLKHESLEAALPDLHQMALSGGGDVVIQAHNRIAVQLDGTLLDHPAPLGG